MPFSTLGLASAFPGRIALRPARTLACLASLVLVALAAACPNGAESTRATPRAPRRVVLIGLDGADWKVIRPLLAEGKMPRLKMLIEGGASGDLRTLLPALSPIIWTTIATGVGPAVHGIEGFWHLDTGDSGRKALPPEEEEQQERLRALGYIQGPSERGENRMILYRSTDRRTPALWNMLDASGSTSDVLAWWVTYPAEAIRGVMVSDRYLYNRFALVAKERGMPYETSGGLVSPPDAAARLAPYVVSVEKVGAADLKRFIDGPIDVHSALELHAVEDELRTVYAKDESVVRMTKALIEKEQPRLLAAYIQGIDIASHYFWKYRFPEEWNRMFPKDPVPRGELVRYRRVVDEYYQLQDRNLGEMLDRAGEGIVTVVCSDHGFVTGKRPPGTPGAASTVSGVHEEAGPPGIVVLHGAGIRRGVRLEGASVYDIAPTVLALLDVPPAPGMEGHPLKAAFDTPATP